jgi:hypothetical protein
MLAGFFAYDPGVVVFTIKVIVARTHLDTGPDGTDANANVCVIRKARSDKGHSSAHYRSRARSVPGKWL